MRAYIIRNEQGRPDRIKIVADTDEDRDMFERACDDGVKVLSCGRGITEPASIELFVYPSQRLQRVKDIG